MIAWILVGFLYLNGMGLMALLAWEYDRLFTRRGLMGIIAWPAICFIAAIEAMLDIEIIKTPTN